MSLRDKMLAVMTDVNSAVAEREELVELIAIALLTRKNLFILGDPGQAKSYAINAFRSRITGAKQFERLLSKQTDEEQLFGRLDLSSLIPGSVPESAFESDGIYQNLRFDLQSFLNGLPQMKNEAATFDKLAEACGKLDAYRKAVAALHPCEPVVQTVGKIPEADIVFLDEIFKCNDGVLNALLTALNERKYTNEGRTYPIPTISFFAASNEIPNFNDPEEKILSALYDRLELKVVTENISEKAHRLAILKDKLGGSFGTVHVTLSLEELHAMQQEVAAIKVPDSIHDLMDDVLCALRTQFPVSDRKFLSYFSIAQAKAWLEGHTEVTSTDLLVLRNYFWQKPSDREFVTGTLERLCVNPMQEKVSDILAMAQDAKDGFDSASGATDNTRTKQAALRKFRGELLRLYQMQTEMAANAASDSEKTLTDGLLSELERINKTVHESIGFTYMKNTVDAMAFYKVMTALMEVTSKSSIEVLREIKAEFTGDQCVLSATDLNTWMSVTLPASGDSFDFVFWNSANIQKICRHYDGALELELQQRGDESFLTMRSGGKGGEFPVYDTKDCPEWSEIEVKQTYTANAAKLLACVKQVKYAVDSRNVRPEYQGVLFQNKHIWAVEGRRAGCCDDGGLDVEPSFIVGVPELEQLKAFGSTEMKIDIAEDWVLFRKEHVRLLAKRILNVTPITYESVVPRKWNEEFCFHRKDFVQALKYLLACTEKNDKPYVRFQNGNLSLHANGCLYKAKVSISTESSIVIGFDARFMLDALTQFEKQERVTMRLTGSLGAILLIAGNSSAIVLPVRLREEQKAA